NPIPPSPRRADPWSASLMAPPSMPGTVIRPQRRLVALGVLAQRLAPLRVRRPGVGRVRVTVQRRAPGPRDRGHVGRAALAAFDLQCGDAGAGQARQQVEGVEAGRFLERVEDLTADIEAALAHGGVAGWFLRRELVDQDLVEAHAAAAVGLFVPAHELRRRAHAMAVRRRAGDVTGEL